MQGREKTFLGVFPVSCIWVGFYFLFVLRLVTRVRVATLLFYPKVLDRPSDWGEWKRPADSPQITCTWRRWHHWGIIPKLSSFIYIGIMFFLFSNQCFCLGQFNELVFPEPASHLLSLVREWHGRELAHREKTGTDQRHRKQFSISMRSSAGLFSFHGDIFLVGKPFLIFKKCTPKSFPSILVSFRGKDFTAVIEWLCVALGQHLSLYRSPPSQWLRELWWVALLCKTGWTRRETCYSGVKRHRPEIRLCLKSL